MNTPSVDSNLTTAAHHFADLIGYSYNDYAAIKNIAGFREKALLDNIGKTKESFGLIVRTGQGAAYSESMRGAGENKFADFGEVIYDCLIGRTESDHFESENTCSDRLTLHELKQLYFAVDSLLDKMEKNPEKTGDSDAYIYIKSSKNDRDQSCRITVINSSTRAKLRQLSDIVSRYVSWLESDDSLTKARLEKLELIDSYDESGQRTKIPLQNRHTLVRLTPKNYVKQAPDILELVNSVPEATVKLMKKMGVRNLQVDSSSPKMKVVLEDKQVEMRKVLLGQGKTSRVRLGWIASSRSHEKGACRFVAVSKNHAKIKRHELVDQNAGSKNDNNSSVFVSPGYSSSKNLSIKEIGKSGSGIVPEELLAIGNKVGTIQSKRSNEIRNVINKSVEEFEKKLETIIPRLTGSLQGCSDIPEAKELVRDMRKAYENEESVSSASLSYYEYSELASCSLRDLASSKNAYMLYRIVPNIEGSKLQTSKISLVQGNTSKAFADRNRGKLYYEEMLQGIATSKLADDWEEIYSKAREEMTLGERVSEDLGFFDEVDDVDFVKSLHKVVKELDRFQNALAEKLVSLVERAHRELKIVHGDIKPDNVLVYMDKDKIQLKLCDFESVVRINENGEFISSGFFSGSLVIEPHKIYGDAELFAGNFFSDLRARDDYGLGMTLLFLLGATCEELLTHQLSLVSKEQLLEELPVKYQNENLNRLSKGALGMESWQLQIEAKHRPHNTSMHDMASSLACGQYANRMATRLLISWEPSSLRLNLKNENRSERRTPGSVISVLFKNVNLQLPLDVREKMICSDRELVQHANDFFSFSQAMNPSDLAEANGFRVNEQGAEQVLYLDEPVPIIENMEDNTVKHSYSKNGNDAEVVNEYKLSPYGAAMHHTRYLMDQFMKKGYRVHELTKSPEHGSYDIDKRKKLTENAFVKSKKAQWKRRASRKVFGVLLRDRKAREVAYAEMRHRLTDFQS